MFIIEIIENPFAGLGSLFAFILIIALVSNACNGNATTTKTGNEIIEDAFQTTETTIPAVADLASLHVLESHSKVLNDNIRQGPVCDAYGNEYTGSYFALTSVYSLSEGWKEAYTELVTGANYQTLTGTFFADADYDSYEIVFKIYADDTLILDSGSINRKTKPIDFSVSISNVNVIKVSATAQNVDSTTQAAHVILTNAVVSL